MSKMSLLLDESPIVFQGRLACIIGLSEAIVLQTLQYYCNNKKCGKVVNDQRWIYNTYEEWQELAFPFWSPRAIAETFRTLEKMGFVASEKFDKKDGMNRKYYTVTHAAKAVLTTEKLTHLEETSSWGGMRKNLPDGEEESSRSARARLIKEYTENHTENHSCSSADEREQRNDSVEEPSNPPDRQNKPPEQPEDKVMSATAEQKTTPNSVSPPPQQYSADFETFWTAYPRKIGKQAAYREWKRCKVDLPTALKAIEQQRKAGMFKEQQFIIYPERWIKNGRWEECETAPQLRVNAPVASSAPQGGSSYQRIKQENLEDAFWNWFQSRREWEERRNLRTIDDVWLDQFVYSLQESEEF
jgi:DNA-binding PadR family transcriptional regulator